MSKMTKKQPKAKIPRDLSDKDMLKNFVEEETIETKFVKAEAAQVKKKKEEAEAATLVNLSRMGFTPALTDELGKALTQLKMELALQGITSYGFRVKKEGQKIILEPKINLGNA